jgi:hypothetical protein
VIVEKEGLMDKQRKQRTAALSRRQGTAACCAVLFSLCAAAPLHLQAGESPPLEYQVKAAYLLNFLKFVEWPKGGAQPVDANTPYTIGVLGHDPLGNVLDDTLRGKNVDGRAVRAVRCNNEEEAARCHLVFISKDEKRELRPAIEKLLAGNVLLVGEGGDFLRAGGAIRFVIADERVRFEIDQGNAERAGLKISAKLLQLARRVFKKGDAQ